MPEYKVFSFSDAHPPHLHKGAWAETMQALREWNPDAIVANGDITNGEFTSRHGKDARVDSNPVTEMRAIRDLFVEINDNARDALKVWNWGNHDKNFLHYQPDRRDPDTYALIMALWEEMVVAPGILKGWIIKDDYKHQTSWRIGQMTFQHGCDVSDAGLRQNAISYCTPHGLYVSGHTHRPQEVTQLRFGKALSHYWTANTGCLVDVDQMHYMDRTRIDLWGHAYLRGYVNAPGLKEGRKVYAEKRWDAETVILRMFAENWAPNSLAR